jgi:glycerophosphoryl diester phosphodiesterase
MLTQTHFISFDWEALKKVKIIEPSAILFALADTKHNGNEALALGYNISIQGNLITRKYIKSIHEKNLLISIWTIDSKLLASIIQKLYKIDFITSNKLVLK